MDISCHNLQFCHTESDSTYPLDILNIKYRTLSEGRAQKMIYKYLKLLDPRCQKMRVFCLNLQPIRNHFPWFARQVF